MKLLRIVFYLLMPVFLAAGLYTGMRIWYIFLFAQVLLLLVILGLNQWTVRTFSYTQTLDADTGVKGEETGLHLSVRNEKPFPLSMMRVDVEMAAPSENTQVSFSLLPFAGREFDFRVRMPYRGVYPMGITTMRITDVFGLLPMRFDMRRLHYYRQPELTVYPRAEAPGSLYADVADEKLFGERYLLSAESGSSVTGARAYRPGDPLKQIHWKKTAARGEVYVKQYEQPMRENVLILLDNADHGMAGEAALAAADTVCEAAACITLHCLSRRRSAALLAMNGTRGVRQGEEALDMGDFERVRRWLAQLPFDAGPLPDPLPPEALAGNSALILVTSAYTRELEDLIARVSPYFSAVTPVLVGDAAEAELPPSALRLKVGCDVAAELIALD